MRYTNAVIADRHPVVLQGLSKLLGAQRDFRIVASCGNWPACIEAIRIFLPDIAIVDLSMFGTTGLEMIACVKLASPATRLVLFATSFEDDNLAMLAAAGASGLIPKDADPDALVQALRRIANGERLLPPLGAARSTEQSNLSVEDVLAALTDRERQIIRLVTEGLSNKEIGRRLNITDGTIKVHLHNIFGKLGVSNRTELAALALSQDQKQFFFRVDWVAGSED
jgi:two-component system, NarL family, nitrate/nitrite response regulator NarL